MKKLFLLSAFLVLSRVGNAQTSVNTFYFQKGVYPTVASRIANGTPTQAKHLTLEGALQQFLDGVHMQLNLRATAVQYGLDIDPSLAEQTSLDNINFQIDLLGRFWPRMFLDSVTAPDTIESLTTQYKKAAADLFSAYGL